MTGGDSKGGRQEEMVEAVSYILPLGQKQMSQSEGRKERRKKLKNKKERDLIALGNNIWHFVQDSKDITKL